MPQTAQALNPDTRLTQYLHTSWRIQDGSLPAGMFSIAQTSDGFLWLLSLPGDLYRFDGVRFVRWPVPAGPSGRVFADSGGGLWVTARELVRLRKGIVASRFELAGIHGFQSISEQPEGTVWVGLRGEDAPLCRISDQKIRCFGKTERIPLSAINAVLPDGSGGLWLGGPTALVHWRPDGVSETYPTKADIRSLARTRDGTLWVGLAEEGPGLGLQQLRGGVLKTFLTAHFDGSTVAVTSLMTDRDGNLWVGTDAGGVVRIHGDAVERYRQTDGLSGDSVWALLEDREGIVWAGTTSGIDSFRDPRVVTFSAVQGLGKDQAAGILATQDGTVWVANHGSLDRIRDGTVTSIGKRNGLPGNQVAAMLEDRAGNVWVGVDDGLYLFNDGQFRRLPEPDHQPLGMVVGLTEDVDGNIWAACGSPRRLVRIRDFQVREVLSEAQAPPRSHHLAPDPHGGIWIASATGQVVLMRNGRTETTIPLEPRSSPLNRHIVAGADGSVLVSSEGGLVGWRAGKVQRMTTKNGLPCDFVIAFVQDTRKDWWLYTRCGVATIPDAEFQKWWANADARIGSRVYDAFDGAQPNIGSFNAAASTADGRVWFSTGVVVQMLDPSRTSQPARPAAASIESVMVDRKEFAAADNLEVGPNPRDLQIDYTSPTFWAAQRVKFRYKLDGYDDGWHEAGTRRQAFYTDLPPGKYSFQVIASNSEGLWNDTPARLDFSVAPAYYETGWFGALSAVFVVALLGAAYYWRVRQLQRRFEITLDARVHERTRIARDLHDTLLQSSQGLLLRYETVARLLPERPGDAKQKLDNVIEQNSWFIAEARNAVQGLRASTAMTNDLARAIRTLGDELAESEATGYHAAQFAVAVEGESRDLHPILRDEIYKIAAEALRNAFRHAQPKRVEVEIRYGAEQFRLRVRDDGRGIDPAVVSGERGQGHFGLGGMRERATLIGGHLTVWSEVNAGTEVELRIPATSAYVARLSRKWRRSRQPETGDAS